MKWMKIFTMLLLTSAMTFASNVDYMDKLIDDYPDEIEAVAMYPDDVRVSILEMTQYPALLVDVADLQENTKERFQRFINNFSRSDQQDIYELFRYPDLLQELVAGGFKSESQVHKIVREYPDDIYEIATDWSVERFSDLKSLYHFDRRTIREFDRLLDEYPIRVQDLAREMINIPEIITVLTDEMDFTLALGDLYNDDPDWLLDELDALNFVYAEQNAEELSDYRDSLENDPDAYQEMQDAARRYADENNIHVSYDEPTVVDRHVVYVYRPYPYWYGYPHWHSVVYWRPVPWYYHAGFYFGSGGRAIVFRLPSYHYVHWHHYHHPSYYPHLSHHYYVHYNRYPHSHNNFHRAVHTNVVHNTNVKINRNVVVKERSYNVSRTDYKRTSTKRSTVSTTSSRRLASRENPNKNTTRITSERATTRTSRVSSDANASRRSSTSRDVSNSRSRTSRVSEPAQRSSSSRSTSSRKRDADKVERSSRNSSVSTPTRNSSSSSSRSNKSRVSTPSQNSSSSSSRSTSNSRVSNSDRSSRVQKAPTQSDRTKVQKKSSSQSSRSTNINRSSNNKSRSSANRSSSRSASKSNSSRSSSSNKSNSSKSSSSRTSR